MDEVRLGLGSSRLYLGRMRIGPSFGTSRGGGQHFAVTPAPGKTPDIAGMGANSCCFTSEHVADEAKARMTGDVAMKEDSDKHVQFHGEVPTHTAPVKTQRTKERKGTGYVKPDMLKDVVDEEDD
eukprot:s1478_g4.t1